MRGALACLVAALIFSGSPTAAEPDPGGAAQACWSSAALAAKPGEEIFRRRVSQAFVAPPKRMPAEFSPAQNFGALRRVKLPPGKKLVALTFDLCETPHEVAGYQGDIVDFLRKNNIKATFFAGGKWMLTHSSRTEQVMSDPLFEVGNHTWEHRNLRRLKGSSLMDEIERGQVAYEVVRDQLAVKQCVRPDTQSPARAPRRLSLFRFPFGACSAEALAAVAHAGLLPVQWDLSSGDPSPGQSARQMTRWILHGVHPGSIVLFHANGRGWHTGSALPGIVAGLKAQGYEFATVSELMATGEPVYARTCYDSRPGDTDRYDARTRHLDRDAVFQGVREIFMSPRGRLDE